MNLSKNHNFKLESHEKEEGKENLERERGGGYLDGSYTFRRTTNNLVVKVKSSRCRLRRKLQFPANDVDSVGFDEEVEEFRDEFAFGGLFDNWGW